MKERYRSMMEQAVLSEQAKAAFEQKLDNAHPTKKGVRVLRTALIAACVCLVLVVGVAAGTILRHISTGELVSATRPDGTVISLYEVTIPITKLPLDALSAEARDFAAGHMRLPAEKELSDWNEAEKFLGLNLGESPILDKMGSVTVCFYGRTDSPSGIDLHLSSAWANGTWFDPGPYGIVEEKFYTIVSICAEVNTEAMLSTVTEVDRTQICTGTEAVTTDTWVTASGIEVLLANLPDDDGFVAHFLWNGVVYRISAHGTEGAEATISTLKQIVESFSPGGQEFEF